MMCQPSELKNTMHEFVGGSDGRYQHALNRKMIYSEGMKAVAEIAAAYWLIDMIALQMAGIYAKAWRAGTAGTGIVTVTVPAAGGPNATVELSLEDDSPPAVKEELSFTTFPEGVWNFYLGTDEVGA